MYIYNYGSQKYYINGNEIIFIIDMEILHEKKKDE